MKVPVSRIHMYINFWPMILSVQNAITDIDTALHWTRNFADKLNDIHENCYLTNIDETTCSVY